MLILFDNYLWILLFHSDLYFSVLQCSESPVYHTADAACYFTLYFIWWLSQGVRFVVFSRNPEYLFKVFTTCITRASTYHGELVSRALGPSLHSCYISECKTWLVLVFSVAVMQATCSALSSLSICAHAQ